MMDRDYYDYGNPIGIRSTAGAVPVMNEKGTNVNLLHFHVLENTYVRPDKLLICKNNLKFYPQSLIT